MLKELKSGVHGMLLRYGVDTRRLRPDRILLERTIFRHLLDRPEYHRILFVGCAWYTQHYPRWFAQKEFYTIEIDPALARFGAQRHRIDSCENIDRHFDTDSLDCVILNGVYGFGLNALPAITRTFEGIHAVLRPECLRTSL